MTCIKDLLKTSLKIPYPLAWIRADVHLHTKEGHARVQTDCVTAELCVMFFFHL